MSSGKRDSALGRTLLVTTALTAGLVASHVVTREAHAQDGRTETTEGTVQGVYDASAGVWEFRGLRYAAPAGGARRFARPEPPAPHDGVLLADDFAPVCPQVAGGLPDACTAGAAPGAVVGDEDCLALNVVTPARDWPPRPTRPVMVYIHGGAFESGCEVRTTPALAARGDVVLVRIQYRVGLLGFLGTEEMAADDAHGSAGNWGILDAIRALEWVRDNAAAFGGDPRNVTVFGESAGGVAVCTLLASPLADGLFRRAIVQSGHCQIARPLRTSPGSALDGATQAQIGSAIVAEIGCPLSGPGQLECLRALPVAAVTGVQPRLAGLGLGSLQATIDGHVLDERPLSVLRARGGDGRALLIGSNRDEYSAVALLDPTLGARIRTDYDGAVRDGLDGIAAILRPIPLAALARDVLALYPDPGDPDARVARYAELFGDLYGNCPVLDAAAAAARDGTAVRVYHFSESVPSPVPQIADLGAFHSLDVFFVFGDLPGLAAALPFTPGAEEQRVADRMMDAWAGFAARGVPRTAPAWPLWTRATERFYEWSAESASAPVRSRYRDGRCVALGRLLASLDRDGDLVADADDNCPGVANASQLDADGDGIGDRCEPCGSAPRVAAPAERAPGRTALPLGKVRAPCAPRVPTKP